MGITLFPASIQSENASFFSPLPEPERAWSCSFKFPAFYCFNMQDFHEATNWKAKNRRSAWTPVLVKIRRRENLNNTNRTIMVTSLIFNRRTYIAKRVQKVTLRERDSSCIGCYTFQCRPRLVRPDCLVCFILNFGIKTCMHRRKSLSRSLN